MTKRKKDVPKEGRQRKIKFFENFTKFSNDTNSEKKLDICVETNKF